jgi:DNA-binding transcriptional MerR regulator
MATAAARPQPIEIPNKLYFRIGDVSKLTNIKQYVLRFWESEFPMLNPKKSGTNQRLYRRKDVETVLEIKHLLYEKRFTIEGARTFLQTRTRNAPKPAPVKKAKQAALFAMEEPSDAKLAAIKEELSSILSLLS